MFLYHSLVQIFLHFVFKQEHSGSRKIMTFHRNTLSFIGPVRHSTHAGSVSNSYRTVAHVVDRK